MPKLLITITAVLDAEEDWYDTDSPVSVEEMCRVEYENLTDDYTNLNEYLEICENIEVSVTPLG